MKIWVSAVKHNCLTNFRCLNCDFSTERASSCYCTSCNDEHVCSIWPCTNGDRSRVWKMSEMFSSLNSCHIDKVTSNDAVPFVREGRAPCQENRARGDTYCKEVLREATGSWKRACNHLAIIYLKSGTIATSQPVQLSLCHALTAQINGKGWVGGLEKDEPRLSCSVVAIVNYLPRMTDDFNLLLARLVQLMALDVAMSILLNWILVLWLNAPACAVFRDTTLLNGPNPTELNAATLHW